MFLKSFEKNVSKISKEKNKVFARFVSVSMSLCPYIIPNHNNTTNTYICSLCVYDNKMSINKHAVPDAVLTLPSRSVIAVVRRVLTSTNWLVCTFAPTHVHSPNLCVSTQSSGVSGGTSHHRSAPPPLEQKGLLVSVLERTLTGSCEIACRETVAAVTRVTPVLSLIGKGI